MKKRRRPGRAALGFGWYAWSRSGTRSSSSLPDSISPGAFAAHAPQHCSASRWPAQDGSQPLRTASSDGRVDAPRAWSARPRRAACQADSTDSRSTELMLVDACDLLLLEPRRSAPVIGTQATFSQAIALLRLFIIAMLIRVKAPLLISPVAQPIGRGDSPSRNGLRMQGDSKGFQTIALRFSSDTFESRQDA